MTNLLILHKLGSTKSTLKPIQRVCPAQEILGSLYTLLDQSFSLAPGELGNVNPPPPCLFRQLFFLAPRFTKLRDHCIAIRLQKFSLSQLPQSFPKVNTPCLFYLWWIDVCTHFVSAVASSNALTSNKGCSDKLMSTLTQVKRRARMFSCQNLLVIL